MKITDVQTAILAKRSLFVKVVTDEGITGYGECSPMNLEAIRSTVDHAVRPLVLGMDPQDVEAINQQVLIKGYKLGPGGILTNALAGVDIALWDIIGKALNQPIYKLLGGAIRKRIRMYASIGRADMSPLEVARLAADRVEKGFTAIKVRMDLRENNKDPMPDPSLDYVRETRAAIGDQVLLMFDANNGFSPARAIQLGRKLEQYNIFHFEEPVAAYDYAGMAQVSTALDLPIAAGEQEYTRWQVRDLILQGKPDVLQPDLVKSGGFTESRKICALAQAFDKPVTVHNTQPTIGTVASLHLTASLTNAIYPQEYIATQKEHPLVTAGLMQPPLVLRDGYFDVPEGPGLGITIDQAVWDRLAE